MLFLTGTKGALTKAEGCFNKSSGTLPGPKDLSDKLPRSLSGGPRVQLDLIVVSIRVDEGSNNAKAFYHHGPKRLQ